MTKPLAQPSAVTVNAAPAIHTLKRTTLYNALFAGVFIGAAALLISGTAMAGTAGSCSDPSGASGQSYSLENATTTNDPVCAGAAADATDVTNNTLSVANSQIGDLLAGGFNQLGTGSANGNTVTLSNITPTGGNFAAVGGRSDGGEANNNTLTVVNSQMFSGGTLVGGDGALGAANNEVILDGTESNALIWGGHSANGLVTGNKVTLTNHSTSDRSPLGG